MTADSTDPVKHAADCRFAGLHGDYRCEGECVTAESTDSVKLPDPDERDLHTVTLTFEVDAAHLRATTDFNGKAEGITVSEVAAWLLRHHAARDGYIHFTVTAGNQPSVKS